MHSDTAARTWHGDLRFLSKSRILHFASTRGWISTPRRRIRLSASPILIRKNKNSRRSARSSSLTAGSRSSSNLTRRSLLRRSRTTGTCARRSAAWKRSFALWSEHPRYCSLRNSRSKWTLTRRRQKTARNSSSANLNSSRSKRA